MASFGESLRRERELRDISLREIADATKINLRYLEALEQNRFDILPGGVFNKGFIRAFARFIGADGESLVDAYLQEIAAREPGVVAAAGNDPGVLRTTGTPRRRTDPGAVPIGVSRLPTPPPPRPQAPKPPAAAPKASAPAPKEPAAPTAPQPDAPVVPVAAVAPVAPQAAVGPAAVAPAAETHPVAAARPVAPLRVLAAPPRGEPLTERAAAIAAITNPVPAGETPARKKPVLNLGVVIAAAGLVIAGGLAILVARGFGAGDGARRPVATPATSETDAAILEASLGPLPLPTPGDGASPADGGAEGIAAIGTTSAAGTASTRHDDVPPRDDAAASAIGTPRNSAPQAQGSPVASPAAPREPFAAPPSAGDEPPRAAAQPGMEFRIEANAQVWVQVSCDGEDKVNRMLQAGEGATLRCLSVVRVSVTDGGAVRLLVDGARCVIPGESGFEMKGFVIRTENAAAICPPAAGGPNGRR